MTNTTDITDTADITDNTTDSSVTPEMTTSMGLCKYQPNVYKIGGLSNNYGKSFAHNKFCSMNLCTQLE